MFVPFLGKPFYLVPSCFGFRASAHNFIKQTLIRAPVNGFFSRKVNSHDYFPPLDGAHLVAVRGLIH